ncbi:hypothetical protein [Streptomyces sp. MZ04]|uniref:hypothetical protein n=1 Tax=Streptomyces sp. MZ04 TaxID=2559236 RepID=UPI00107EC898|nr:hypothetical protein [Streptomyces sp. MZ04]TGB08117.1 hypothetical protein E2651_20280 [Streptomyces sp. MZ04]
MIVTARDDLLTHDHVNRRSWRLAEQVLMGNSVKSLNVKRVLVAASIAAAAAVVPIVTAAPASATPLECINYLEHQGYPVGPKVINSCKNGDSGSVVIRQSCPVTLVSFGVKSNHAATACRAARA